MRRFFLFFLLLFSTVLNAQVPQPLFTGIDHISVSRQGNLLMATRKGDVQMLDSSGKISLQFSPRKPARIHLLEAWNGLRIFAFNRDFQHYLVLDRFLLSDGPAPLDRDRAYARLLAPSQDGNLWLLDEASFELKKMEFSSGRILFSTPLDLVLKSRQGYEFSFMREYQNQLYLADRNGPILVFDVNGTFRKSLPLPHCEWFGFEGDELLCVQNGDLTFHHLIKNSLRKQKLPEFLNKTSEVILLNGKMYALQDTRLYCLNASLLK